MKIWEMVKAIEEEDKTNYNRGGESLATLWVNYGNNGRCRKGIIKPDHETDLLLSLLDVCTWYENKLKEFEEKENLSS